MTESFLLVLGAFLLGSLPFSFWVARSSSGMDLRTSGSGNPGATNVLRVAGKRAAVQALFLDIAKGAIPVAAALGLGSSERVVAMAAVAAMSGHILSPFLGLKGGKGVATSIGALTVLNPLAACGGILVFLVLVAWKRYVSLGSTVGAVVIAFLASVTSGVGTAGRAGALAAGLIAILVIMRHLPNVRRLLAGKEPQIGEKVTRL